MTAATRRGALVWFRRDLRDYDHHALAQALAAGPPVYAAFVFDRDILDRCPRPPTAVSSSSGRACASSTPRCAAAAAG